VITFWSAILAVSVLLYVVLDGFDLGVGMLFGSTSDAEMKSDMLASISPVWDGNETWLIVAGVVLWGAFPGAYATLLAAFYIPISVMLASLVFRGVAFEFRVHASRSRWIWNIGLSLGSLCAGFMQGAMVGALAHGLPVENGRFVGNALSWLSAFSVVSGVALCFGYALLGAAWIAMKCEGPTRELALLRIRRLAWGVLLLLVVLFTHVLGSQLIVLHRWTHHPALFWAPAIGLILIAAIVFGARPHSHTFAFGAVIALFVCAYAMFAISFWPNLIPFSVTLDQAAAPRSSLSFMFWGAGLFIFPLMLIYTFCSYYVFRGKVDRSAWHA
jgi:cytochrome d ubiquinol oxidase subunit II